MAFTPLKILDVTIQNRIVMAPMTRRRAFDDGAVDQQVAEYYAKRAAGGVGLIVTEGVHINNDDAIDGDNSPRCHTAEQIQGWKRVTELCKERSSGNVRMCMQLWHTGIFSRSPIGPSAVDASTEQRRLAVVPRAATSSDLDRIAAEFALTAQNAIERCGFDMVQIHGAHGYFVDSFASPKLNLRTDEYGGTTSAQRSNLAVKIVNAVRQAVGDRVPISFRFSQWIVNDYLHTKFSSPDDLAQFVVALARAGVDMIDVSTRRLKDSAFPLDIDPLGLPLAVWTKRILRENSFPDVTVCGVGSVAIARPFGDSSQSFDVVDPTVELELVATQAIDLVGVGRGLIADPCWVIKVASGHWHELTPYSTDLLQHLQ